MHATFDHVLVIKTLFGFVLLGHKSLMTHKSDSLFLRVIWFPDGADVQQPANQASLILRHCPRKQIGKKLECF